MAANVDSAAFAMATTWQHLFEAIPGSWCRREGGVVAGVTGVPVPTLNGVWAEDVAPDEAVVTELLDLVAASGVPYCLQLRPEARTSARLDGLAAARGLTADGQIPLMVLDDAGALEPAQQVDRLKIRQLPPEAAREHAVVAAAGFEAPVDLFEQLVTPVVLRAPGVRCYVGEVDGQPVTTGVGVTLGDFVGIFDVATRPENRGRRYGSALTARAICDGFADGAQWSWLQSTPDALGVYGRLGFRSVGAWDCWVSSV